jgi:hypothetical protein
LLHVVPPRIPRIRHVGFLANCTKKIRLAQCWRLLDAAPLRLLGRSSPARRTPACVLTITPSRWARHAGSPRTPAARELT